MLDHDITWCILYYNGESAQKLSNRLPWKCEKWPNGCNYQYPFQLQMIFDREIHDCPNNQTYWDCIYSAQGNIHCYLFSYYKHYKLYCCVIIVLLVNEYWWICNFPNIFC